MNLLSLEKVSKTMHDVPLFSDVSFGLDEGEHVGLVGKNGAGKSTLLSIIAETVQMDEGTISLRKDADVVMLPQLITFKSDDTIDTFLLDGGGKRITLRREYRQGNHSPAMEEALHAYDSWSLEDDYHALLGEIGMGDPSLPMHSLSGGELKKVAIARTLVSHASLLLLDEPTNHLDIQTIEWLESWVSRSSKTIIIVTHDRYFLDSVSTSILEIGGGTTHLHPGSFSDYLERRAERLDNEQKEQVRLKAILRRELVWLQRGPKARTGKDSGRKERITEMQASLHKVGDDRQRQFSSQERRLGKKILTLKDIGKGYGDKNLFSHFSYDFLPGDRIGVIGPNGSGKSTLLDIVMGLTQPDQGTVERGVNTVIAYYDQRSRDLPEEKTITEYVADKAERIRLNDDEVVSPARFLELFGFPEKMQRGTISHLSGGEKRRLYLVSKLLDNPNFLLLDEPTNDLDLETMENLEEYIRSFSGCVLIVSHDRSFLDQSCGTLFALGDGKTVKPFTGSFSEWEKENQQQKDEGKEEEKKKTLPQERRHTEKKGLSFKEKQEYGELGIQLKTIEQKQKELEASFTTAQATALGTLEQRNKLYEDNKLLQEKLEERWLTLMEKAEKT